MSTYDRVIRRVLSRSSWIDKTGKGPGRAPKFRIRKGRKSYCGLTPSEEKLDKIIKSLAISNCTLYYKFVTSCLLYLCTVHAWGKAILCVCFLFGIKNESVLQRTRTKETAKEEHHSLESTLLELNEKYTKRFTGFCQSTLQQV